MVLATIQAWQVCLLLVRPSSTLRGNPISLSLVRSSVESEATPLSESAPSLLSEHVVIEDDDDELLDEASCLLFGSSVANSSLMLPLLRVSNMEVQYGWCWFLYGQGHIGTSARTVRKMEIFVPVYPGKESGAVIILATT